MALVVRLRLFLISSSFKFHPVTSLLITLDPNSLNLNLNPLNCHVWGKVEYTRYNWSQKQFRSLKTHNSWFSLPCRRKPSVNKCHERLPQAITGMCVSQWWTFWTQCDHSRI